MRPRDWKNERRDHVGARAGAPLRPRRSSSLTTGAHHARTISLTSLIGSKPVMHMHTTAAFTSKIVNQFKGSRPHSTIDWRPEQSASIEQVEIAS